MHKNPQNAFYWNYIISNKTKPQKAEHKWEVNLNTRICNKEWQLFYRKYIQNNNGI